MKQNIELPLQFSVPSITMTISNATASPHKQLILVKFNWQIVSINPSGTENNPSGNEKYPLKNEMLPASAKPAKSP